MEASLRFAVDNGLLKGATKAITRFGRVLPKEDPVFGFFPFSLWMIASNKDPIFNEQQIVDLNPDLPRKLQELQRAQLLLERHDEVEMKREPKESRMNEE